MNFIIQHKNINNRSDDAKLCLWADNRPYALVCFNPLGDNSDQHQFSPNNIQQIIKSKSYENYLIDYQRENTLILKPNSHNFS